MVQGASLLLFCHDDIAPDPDAVHIMVEESFRSNAGVVGPKLVSWDDPARLLHVGMAVDKGGAVVDRMEPGEIDHGQHDAVRDIFLAPGGCTLVRADLFTELDGFDPEIFAMGEDLDLCWRAQVLGARVVVAPGARVRHLEMLASGRRGLPERLDSSKGAEAVSFLLDSWGKGVGAGDDAGRADGDGGSAESDDGASRSESAHDAATGAGVDGAAAAGDQGESVWHRRRSNRAVHSRHPRVTLQSLQRRHELHAALEGVRAVPSRPGDPADRIAGVGGVRHRPRGGPSRACRSRVPGVGLEPRPSPVVAGAARRAQGASPARRRHGAALATAWQCPGERLRAAGRDARPPGRQSRRNAAGPRLPVGRCRLGCRRSGSARRVGRVGERGGGDGAGPLDAAAGVAGGGAGHRVRDPAALRIGIPDRRATPTSAVMGHAPAPLRERVAAHRCGHDRPHHPGHGDPRPGRHGALRRGGPARQDRRARVHPRGRDGHGPPDATARHGVGPRDLDGHLPRHPRSVRRRWPPVTGTR